MPQFSLHLRVAYYLYKRHIQPVYHVGRSILETYTVYRYNLGHGWKYNVAKLNTKPEEMKITQSQLYRVSFSKT